MWWNQPFYVRLGVLVAVMALGALWDWRRNGRNARRWREYLFLVGSGVLGATVGVLNDLITAHRSPEYFLLGKGVREGASFWPDVLRLAVEAGFIAGAVLGGVLLLANTCPKSRASLPLRIVARQILIPVLGIAIGVLVAANANEFIPIPGAISALELDASLTGGIHQVWCMHVGLYAGAIFGTALAVVRLSRRRKTSLSQNAQRTQSV